MAQAALIGAGGFVGSAAHSAMLRRGVQVKSVPAPRLLTSARTLPELHTALDAPETIRRMAQLRDSLTGCDVVVNCAGAALATGAGDMLYGANALLPGVVASAAPPHARVLHISSSGVQGRRAVLDESSQTAPFSPYTSSKALGEALLLAVRPDGIVYRPTSVHGLDRPVTKALVRILRSPLASVASGANPSPQALVENVGDAVAFLALTTEQPPTFVLHPWEGLTTRTLYTLLGGRSPIVIPSGLARALLSLGKVLARFSVPLAGEVRRVEMLWMGQRQASSWLQNRWNPPVGYEGWTAIAEAYGQSSS